MGNILAKFFKDKEINQLKDHLNTLRIKLDFSHELKKLKDEKKIIDPILNQSIASLETEINETNQRISEIYQERDQKETLNSDSSDDDCFSTYYY